MVVTALVVTACGTTEPPEPRTTADLFAEALSTQNVAAAAELTSDPAAATETLKQMYDGLRGGGTVDATPRFSVSAADEEAQTFTLSASWSFTPPEPEADASDTSPAESTDPETAQSETSGSETSDSETSGSETSEPESATDPSAERVWTYDTEGSATETPAGWRITWNPATVVPGLTADTSVRYTPTGATAVPSVLDSSGSPLMTQQVVTLVNLDTTADTSAVAALVSSAAPTVTAESLRESLDAASGGTITAVALRDSDLAPIETLLTAVPGVTLAPQTRLLTVNPALASPALNDVAQEWQDQQDENAGWSVQLVNADGAVAEQLVGVDPTVGSDIQVTLDSLLQLRAENALAAVPQSAAIVAITPSTGAVVAVAQNGPADSQGPIALTGLYPPGSTFKTVTTSAALQAGEVTPETVLPCPASANIEGRTIPNDDDFALGEVPLTEAFARSCNTTMAQLAADLPPEALPDAALQFGLGADFVTPGLTTVTGSVPPATTPAERVESGIGQGTVTASPFGMALVAAAIANGATPTPTMITGRPATADTDPEPFPAEVAEQLRAMMAETVASGTASSLQDISGLLGKTGTAEVQGGPSHGWFVGIRGDLAFAVFVEGGDTSAPALAAAGAFLR